MGFQACMDQGNTNAKSISDVPTKTAQQLFFFTLNVAGENDNVSILCDTSFISKVKFFIICL